MIKQDLNEIRTLIKEEVSASEKRLTGELAASEKRLEGKLEASEKRLVGEINKSEKKVLGEVGKFVTDELLPAIDEKADKADIERLERKIDLLGDKNAEFNSRITQIESIPIIAHELKHKKSK